MVSVTALGATISACDHGKDAGSSADPVDSVNAAPTTIFAQPQSKLSGELKILLGNHFVPSHDTWFDIFAREWGKRVGVNVIVEHIASGLIPTKAAAEIQAQSGHDLIQHPMTLPQFEPSVVDLADVTSEADRRWGRQSEMCLRSSFNPTTGKYYAYAPGWTPGPGNYRRSLWSSIGMPNGPTTWDELLWGGVEIRRTKGMPLGIGMSPEADSNEAGWTLLWSFGARVQDGSERVVINSDATVAAVEYMSQLFRQAMTGEVFSWNPASNNQGLVAGKLSYILNTISAWRTAQDANTDIANDISFVPALRGPSTALAAPGVIFTWIVPQHAANIDAAKEFLLHYTANFQSVTYNSKLYDLPARPSLVPQLTTWLANDPFGARPANKLIFLKDAASWSANFGHPGPANAAIGEVLVAFVLPNMFGRAARGELTPRQAVLEAERQIVPIFEKWRALGLVGG
jgi:hypothetical protein